MKWIGCRESLSTLPLRTHHLRHLLRSPRPPRSPPPHLRLRLGPDRRMPTEEPRATRCVAPARPFGPLDREPPGVPGLVSACPLSFLLLSAGNVSCMPRGARHTPRPGYRTDHSRISPISTGTRSLTSTVKRNTRRASPRTLTGLK